MPGIEEVALYAVLLREAARNHHTSEQSLLDDFECCADEVCFATMLAHEHFTELDWQLVELLNDYPREVLEAAHVLYAEHEQPLEAEALLHAVLPNGKKSAAQWAAPLRERWPQVRASMRAYECESITKSIRDIREIAKDTFRAARPRCTEEDFEVLFGREVGQPIDLGEWERARKHAHMYPSGEDERRYPVDPLTAFVDAVSRNVR